MSSLNKKAVDVNEPYLKRLLLLSNGMREKVRRAEGRADELAKDVMSLTKHFEYTLERYRRCAEFAIWQVAGDISLEEASEIFGEHLSVYGEGDFVLEDHLTKLKDEMDQLLAKMESDVLTK